MLAYLDTCIGLAVVMLGASLVIAILTQAVSAVASFRGTSLRWGLRQLFRNLDPSKLPTIAEYSDEIAQAILTHDLASDSVFASIQWIQKVFPDALVGRYQLASAIRADELAEILKAWAESQADPWRVGAKEIAGQELQDLRSELSRLLDAKNPVAERQIKFLTETSAALKELPLDKAPALISETVRAVRDSAGKLESCFASTMDRVSQQFSTYMRTWTVVFSFVLAGVTGLDAIQLLSTLYTKGDFRAAVTGEAPSMLARAEQILPPGAKSDRDAVNAAIGDLYSDVVSRALAKANISIHATPQGLNTQAQAQAWIRQYVPDASQQKAALDALPGAADEAFSSFMQTNAKNASDIKDILTGAGIQIVNGWSNGFNWPQLLGVLVSGGLLSLGAPFWFNSLKTLTNLRPALAAKVKEEEEQSA